MPVELKVKGGRSNFQRVEKQAVPKKSNFLITINTNKSYKKDDPHLESDSVFFEEKVKEMLNNLPNFLRFPEGDWTENKIKDVDVDYVVEHGNAKGMLHGHVLIKVQHFSNLQVNFTKVKEYLRESLGLKNLYIQGKLVRPSSDQFLLEYINKYYY